MKRVRYALSAIGIAPVIGLPMPMAHAAAAVTHSPKVAKTVSLVHNRTHTGLAATCSSFYSPKKRSDSPHNLTERVYYDQPAGELDCVAHVKGSIADHTASREMRTRIYSHPGGNRTFQGFHSGTILANETSFNSYPNARGDQVCIAIVSESFHSIVRAGPICINLIPSG